MHPWNFHFSKAVSQVAIVLGSGFLINQIKVSHPFQNLCPVSDLKAYILNRFAAKSQIYTSWMSECPQPCEIVETSACDWHPPNDAGIIVTHLHYRWEEISALRRIYETSRVPILILADGILEYRNTWENPTVADGSIFQPLMGHKVACIGRGQARALESWGNVGKCEIVGLPRLDEVYNSEYLPVQDQGPFRLLVTTANTPAFTPEQRSKVVQSLTRLQERVEFGASVNGREIEVTWRLTDGLMEELGLNGLNSFETKQDLIPIADAIELADAVITTPSTLYLESVMKHRPTAILDYSNSPAYVPSAWVISAPLHMNDVLCELESPPAGKMLFQESVLHDQLETGCSRSRLYALIRSMVQAGIDARNTNTPIDLPPRVLSDPQRGIQKVGTNFEMSALYPDNPTFRITDVHRLQQELNQAIARLGQLPAELDSKDTDIVTKNSDIERKEAHIKNLESVVHDSAKRIKKSYARAKSLAELVTKKQADIERKNNHIESMTGLFKEANAKVKALRMEALERKIELENANRRVAILTNRLNSQIQRQKAA